MKLFIDFDDVLFNTKKFAEDIKKIFLDHGVSEDIYYEYRYDESQKDYEIKTYNIFHHLDRVIPIAGIDEQPIRQKVEELVSDTSEYLFTEVEYFLSNFNKQDLYIVSHGNNEYQKEKIDNTKIGDYFNKVMITSKLKDEIIKELIKTENILDNDLYFIDDRVSQLESVKKNIPHVKTILMRRAEGRYGHEEKGDACDFEVGDFGGVEKILVK